MSASESISDELQNFSGATDIPESSLEEVSVVTIVEKINKIWALLQVTNDNLEACDQLLVGCWPQDEATASKNSQNTSKSSSTALITFASHPFVQYQQSVNGSKPSSNSIAEDYKLGNVISSSAPASPLLIVHSQIPLSESSNLIQTSYPSVQSHTVKCVTSTSVQASSLTLQDQIALNVTSVSVQTSSPIIQDDKTENISSNTVQDEMTVTVKSTAIQTSSPVLQTSYTQTSSLTAQDGKSVSLKTASFLPSGAFQNHKLLGVKSTSMQTCHLTPHDCMFANLKSTSVQTTSLGPNDWRIINVKSSAVQTSSPIPQDQTTTSVQTASLSPSDWKVIKVKSSSVQTSSPVPQDQTTTSVQTASLSPNDWKVIKVKSSSVQTSSPVPQDQTTTSVQTASLSPNDWKVIKVKSSSVQTSSPFPQDQTSASLQTTSLSHNNWRLINVKSSSMQTSGPTPQDQTYISLQLYSLAPQNWLHVGVKSVSVQTCSTVPQDHTCMDTKSVPIQASSPAPKDLTNADAKSVSTQTSGPTPQERTSVDGKSVSVQTSQTYVDAKSVLTQTSHPSPQDRTSFDTKSVAIQTSSPTLQDRTNVDGKSVSIQTSLACVDTKSASVQTSQTYVDAKSVSIQTCLTTADAKSVSLQTSSPAPQCWTSIDVKSVSVQTSSRAPQQWTSIGDKSVSVQTSSPAPQCWTSIDVKSVSVQTSSLDAQDWACVDKKCGAAADYQTDVHLKSSAQSTSPLSQHLTSVNIEPKLANISTPSIHDKTPVKMTPSSSHTSDFSVHYEPLTNLTSPSAHIALGCSTMKMASTSAQTCFPIVQYNIGKEEMPVCFYPEQISASEENLCSCALQRTMTVPKSASSAQILYAGDKPNSSTIQKESCTTKHTQTWLFGSSVCTQTDTSVCFNAAVQAVLYCNSSTQTNTAVACQTDKLKGTVNHVVRIEQHCSELYRRITGMLCTVEQQKGEAVQMRIAVDRVLHCLEQEGKEVDQYLLQDAERGKMLLWQCRHSRDITLGTLRALNRRAMLAERQLISERRDLVFLRSKYKKLSKDLYNLKIRLIRHSSQLRFAAQLRYQTHCRYRLQLGHGHRLLNARKNRVRHLQQVLLRVRDLCHSIDSGYQALLCEMWKQIDMTAQLAAQNSNLPAPPSAAEMSKNLADHLRHMLETIRWIQMALSTRQQHSGEGSKAILGSTSCDVSTALGSSPSKEDTMNIITDCSWSEDLTGSDALQRRLLLILDRLQENLLQAGPDVHLTN